MTTLSGLPPATDHAYAGFPITSDYDYWRQLRPSYIFSETRHTDGSVLHKHQAFPVEDIIIDGNKLASSFLYFMQNIPNEGKVQLTAVLLLRKRNQFRLFYQRADKDPLWRRPKLVTTINSVWDIANTLTRVTEADFLKNQEDYLFSDWEFEEFVAIKIHFNGTTLPMRCSRNSLLKVGRVNGLFDPIKAKLFQPERQRDEQHNTYPEIEEACLFSCLAEFERLNVRDHTYHLTGREKYWDSRYHPQRGRYWSAGAQQTYEYLSHWKRTRNSTPHYKYSGVAENELPLFEALFEVNVMLFELKDEHVEEVMHTPVKSMDQLKLKLTLKRKPVINNIKDVAWNYPVMHILQINDHAILIQEPDKLAQSVCPNCYSFFDRRQDLLKHMDKYPKCHQFVTKKQYVRNCGDNTTPYHRADNLVSRLRTFRSFVRQPDVVWSTTVTTAELIAGERKDGPWLLEEDFEMEYPYIADKYLIVFDMETLKRTDYHEPRTEKAEYKEEEGQGGAEVTSSILSYCGVAATNFNIADRPPHQCEDVDKVEHYMIEHQEDEEWEGQQNMRTFRLLATEIIEEVEEDGQELTEEEVSKELIRRLLQWMNEQAALIYAWRLHYLLKARHLFSYERGDLAADDDLRKQLDMPEQRKKMLKEEDFKHIRKVLDRRVSQTKRLARAKIYTWNGSRFDIYLLMQHGKLRPVEEEVEQEEESTEDIIDHDPDATGAKWGMGLGVMDVIQQNGGMTSVSNDCLVYKDAFKLCPGPLSSFLNNYCPTDKLDKESHNSEMRKLFFPHDLMLHYEDLNRGLPSWEECVSHNTQLPVSVQEYDSFIALAKSYKCQTMGDWVSVYAFNDVVPLVYAILNFCVRYWKMGIDPIGHNLGIPSIAERVGYLEARRKNIYMSVPPEIPYRCLDTYGRTGGITSPLQQAFVQHNKVLTVPSLDTLSAVFNEKAQYLIQLPDNFEHVTYTKPNRDLEYKVGFIGGYDCTAMYPATYQDSTPSLYGYMAVVYPFHEPCICNCTIEKHYKDTAIEDCLKEGAYIDTMGYHERHCQVVRPFDQKQPQRILAVDTSRYEHIGAYILNLLEMEHVQLCAPLLTASKILWRHTDRLDPSDILSWVHRRIDDDENNICHDSVFYEYRSTEPYAETPLGQMMNQMNTCSMSDDVGQRASVLYQRRTEFSINDQPPRGISVLDSEPNCARTLVKNVYWAPTSLVVYGLRDIVESTSTASFYPHESFGFDQLQYPTPSTIGSYSFYARSMIDIMHPQRAKRQWNMITSNTRGSLLAFEMLFPRDIHNKLTTESGGELKKNATHRDLIEMVFQSVRMYCHLTTLYDDVVCNFPNVYEERDMPLQWAVEQIKNYVCLVDSNTVPCDVPLHPDMYHEDKYVSYSFWFPAVYLSFSMAKDLHTYLLKTLSKWVDYVDWKKVLPWSSFGGSLYPTMAFQPTSYYNVSDGCIYDRSPDIKNRRWPVAYVASEVMEVELVDHENLYIDIQTLNFTDYESFAPDPSPHIDVVVAGDDDDDVEFQYADILTAVSWIQLQYYWTYLNTMRLMDMSMMDYTPPNLTNMRSVLTRSLSFERQQHVAGTFKQIYARLFHDLRRSLSVDAKAPEEAAALLNDDRFEAPKDIELVGKHMLYILRRVTYSNVSIRFIYYDRHTHIVYIDVYGMRCSIGEGTHPGHTQTLRILPNYEIHQSCQHTSHSVQQQQWIKVTSMPKRYIYLYRKYIVPYNGYIFFMVDVSPPMIQHSDGTEVPLDTLFPFPKIPKWAHITPDELDQMSKEDMEERNLSYVKTVALQHSGKRVLLSHNRLCYLLMHGYTVDKLYWYQVYRAQRPMKEFVTRKNEERKEAVQRGDKATSNQAKLEQNTAFGKSMTRSDKFVQTMTVPVEDLSKHVMDPRFKSAEPMDETNEIYKVVKQKKDVPQDRNIQWGAAILQDSKLYLYMFSDLLAHLNSRGYLNTMLYTDTDCIIVAMENSKGMEAVPEEELFGVVQDKDLKIPGSFGLEKTGSEIVILGAKQYILANKNMTKRMRRLIHSLDDQETEIEDVPLVDRLQLCNQLQESYEISSKGIRQSNNWWLLNLYSYRRALLEGLAVPTRHLGFKKSEQGGLRMFRGKRAIKRTMWKRILNADASLSTPYIIERQEERWSHIITPQRVKAAIQRAKQDSLSNDQNTLIGENSNALAIEQWTEEEEDQLLAMMASIE